jgi:hypothetical protein
MLIENRYKKQSVSQVTPSQVQLNHFIDYFEKNHVIQILQLHLNIILQKRQAFVGTKTLCGALKTVQIGMKY